MAALKTHPWAVTPVTTWLVEQLSSFHVYSHLNWVESQLRQQKEKAHNETNHT